MHRLTVTLALLALGSGIAGADEAKADEGADETEADAAAESHSKAKKKAKEAEKRRTGDTIDVTGRVFTRYTASSEDSAAWQSDLGLDSARIGVDYQWKERLRAEISYEAAKSSVRDAYVQLELGHGLRVRAGRFKLPIGTIEQTSAWTLPTIDRGMVADILNDGLAATGRRSALSMRWRHEGPWRPTLEVAVAQLSQPGGGDTDALVEDGGGLTVVARAEVSPCPMYKFAVAGQSRNVDFVSFVERYWTGSVEAEIDLGDAGYGLRLWGDAMVGQSQFARIAFGEDKAKFLAAHVIAGYRIGGLDRNQSYVEPFIGAGYFNPTLDHERDDVAEIVAGLSGGLWKRWRVQAQFAYRNAKSGRPSALLADQDVNDKLTVTTQLGAAF